MTIKSALEQLAQSIDPGQNLIRIAAIEPAAIAEFEDRVILSIVHIEENPHLRNQSIGFPRTNFSERQLVVSLLFSTAQKDYLAGIDRLQRVVAYLQHHRIFYDPDEVSVVQNEENGIKTPIENPKNNVLFTVEPLALNMEQRAQLWSGLGVGYRPSALYKLTFSN